MNDEKKELAKALYREFGMNLNPDNPERYWAFAADGILRSKWLADHDAKVRAEAMSNLLPKGAQWLKAEAWDECFKSHGHVIPIEDVKPNPYRRTE